jgi:hypothetical protein
VVECLCCRKGNRRATLQLEQLKEENTALRRRLSTSTVGGNDSVAPSPALSLRQGRASDPMALFFKDPSPLPNSVSQLPAIRSVVAMLAFDNTVADTHRHARSLDGPTAGPIRYYLVSTAVTKSLRSLPLPYRHSALATALLASVLSLCQQCQGQETHGRRLATFPRSKLT